MSEYSKPLPNITSLTEPFWSALRAGRLEMQKCNSCGRLRFPPAKVCDDCLSDETTWAHVGGQGTVWSMCEFHRLYFTGFGPELPYNVTLVRLDDGPRMYTNIVGIPYADIKIGMRVEPVFEPVTEDVTLLKFRPAGSVR